jgi:hypothetical protein
MKQWFYLCLVILGVSGCKAGQNSLFYEIVNENFLMLTDTIAYKYHSLLPGPNDSISKTITLNEKYLVYVDTVVEDLKVSPDVLIKGLTNADAKDYTELIEKSKAISLHAIDLANLKNTGRYNLIASPKLQDKMPAELVGQIKFYRPYIAKDKAILFFLIYKAPKAGLLHAFLIKKQNGFWRIKEKIELERW